MRMIIHFTKKTINFLFFTIIKKCFLKRNGAINQKILKNETIIKNLKKNLAKFNRLVKKSSKEQAINLKLDILAKASRKALNCGILNSQKIEEQLIEIAKKQSIELSEDYIDNSFLHILTQAYNAGGHTRVVERWIKNSPDSQIHSLLLINQQQEPIPELLKHLVEQKKGVFYIQDESYYLDKALQLRNIASRYKTIILHIHMDDIIPILAFGTNDFKRPIIFFNHADHEFWLGVSISDLVINLRTWASIINEKRRDVKNNYVLPLPIDEVRYELFNQKEKSKRKIDLGFKEDSLVILTMASSYKYTPFDNYDFIKTIKSILNKIPNAVLLAIGPNKDELMWQQASIETNGRIFAIGIVQNKDISQYLEIADLAIDSLPLGSFTSLLDIAKYNIECLSIRTPINELDSFVNADIFCKDQAELIDKSCLILKNIANKNNKTKLYKILEQRHFASSFYQNLENIYKELPAFHRIKSFKQDKISYDDFDLFKMKVKIINK